MQLIFITQSPSQLTMHACRAVTQNLFNQDYTEKGEEQNRIQFKTFSGMETISPCAGRVSKFFWQRCLFELFVGSSRLPLMTCWLCSNHRVVEIRRIKEQCLVSCADHLVTNFQCYSLSTSCHSCRRLFHVSNLHGFSKALRRTRHGFPSVLEDLISYWDFSIVKPGTFYSSEVQRNIVIAWWNPSFSPSSTPCMHDVRSKSHAIYRMSFFPTETRSDLKFEQTDGGWWPRMNDGSTFCVNFYVSNAAKRYLHHRTFCYP